MNEKQKLRKNGETRKSVYACQLHEANNDADG